MAPPLLSRLLSALSPLPELPPAVEAPPTRRDSIVSSDLGLGVAGRDKRLSARPAAPAWLSDGELASVYATGGIGRRVVQAPAVDAVRSGWRVDTAEDRDVSRELDERLDLAERLAYGYAMARLYGGAVLLLVTSDDDSLEQPLPAGAHDLRAIHVITGPELRPVAWETDPASPRWLSPSVWLVSPIRPGVSAPSIRVHASRAIYLPGLALSPTQDAPRLGLDLSAVDAYWPALRDLELAQSAATVLGIELSTPWLRVGAGKTALAGADADAVRDALALFQRSRSVLGLSVLTSDDEIGRDNASVSGIRDLLVAGYERIASVEGIPLTVLIGQPPAGLSTDDKSGRETYHRTISGIRVDVLTPALRAIYDVALGPDPERVIVWTPLDSPTALEVAQIDAALASRDVALVTAGIVTPEEARARYAGAEVVPYPVLDAVVDEAVEPSEADIAAALAMADAGRADAEPTAEDRERDYRIPRGVQQAAERALRWRDERGTAVDGGTEAGWARARQLAAGGRIRGQEILEIAAWWARHEEDASSISAEHVGEPWRDRGYVSGLLWGGTAGRDWATRIRSGFGDDDGEG